MEATGNTVFLVLSNIAQYFVCIKTIIEKQRETCIPAEVVLKESILKHFLNTYNFNMVETIKT